MDMTESLAAKSDQLNAVDLVEPRTFTIEKVTAGTAEQPFNFHLAELPGKPWRPSKGMRRVLAKGWGAKNVETVYPGRRVTLFCDPKVKWAGAPVGGIRISHMSDIDPDGFSTPLAESKQKREMYHVDLLPELSRRDQLAAEWRTAGPERREQIKAEVAALDAEGAS